MGKLEPGTPLPWKQGTGGGQGGTTHIYEQDAEGNSLSAVASCYLDLVERSYDERTANAAYIVRASNSYGPLLEALERNAVTLRRAATFLADAGLHEVAGDMDQAEERARAAISLASGASA